MLAMVLSDRDNSATLRCYIFERTIKVDTSSVLERPAGESAVSIKLYSMLEIYASINT